MKIMFLVKALSIPGGGAERVLAEISAGLSRRSHEVSIISFDDPKTSDFYDFGDIERIRLGIGNILKSSSVKGTFLRILSIRNLILARRPDIVVAFMHSAYIPVGISLWKSGVPVIASEHIVFEHYKTRPLQTALLCIIPRLVKAITVVSETAKKTFPGFIQRKMQVIPNPVNFNVIRPARNELDGARIILNVGRLEAQKDQRILICAFAKVAKNHPSWRLRIVGEGVLRRDLENLALQLKLEQKIDLPGAQKDILTEYCNADLFVMSSTYESFGIATAEALAAHLPVVGFADCLGTNDLIHDGVNGVLVTGENRIEELASVLDQLMGDPTLRAKYASAAAQSVSKYKLDEVVSQWESLLNRTLSATTEDVNLD